MRTTSFAAAAVALALVSRGHDAKLRAGEGPARIELRANDPDLSTLSWISGSWISRSDGRSAEEHWTHADAGSMFGVSRTIAGGKTVSFEFLRIEKTSDGITYFAAPKGRSPATPFKAVQTEDHRVVFENLKHDFPQRIIYWRESDGPLRARIEGAEAGKQKGSEWTFQPATVFSE